MKNLIFLFSILFLVSCYPITDEELSGPSLMITQQDAKDNIQEAPNNKIKRNIHLIDCNGDRVFIKQEKLYDYFDGETWQTFRYSGPIANKYYFINVSGGTPMTMKLTLEELTTAVANCHLILTE